MYAGSGITKNITPARGNQMISFEKLHRIMEAKGLKKYDLRKAGVNATVLDKALNGTGNIDTRTIDKLCKLLQCQPGDIMEYTEE